MAIIKTTALLSGIKGNMGGSSFYQSPYGNIMSLKGKRKRRKCYEALLAAGVDPQSAAHDCNQLGLTAGGWTGLTPGQKNQWSTLAQTLTFFNRFGDTYQPTGYLVYMQRNLNLARAGLARIDVPGVEVAAPVNFTLLFSAGFGGELEVSVPLLGDLNGFMLILTVFKAWPGFLPPPLGPERIPTNAEVLRNGNGIIGLDAALIGAPRDLSSFWIARYGVTPNGSQQAIGVNFTNKLSGQRFAANTELFNWV